MKIGKITFVSIIIIVSLACMAFMNLHYDSLSRYPYKDENSRAIIKQKLNKDEIEYIIEYSIAPNTFIPFIKEKGFNIYHAAQYHELSGLLWQETPSTIVNMVEETTDIFDVPTLASLLNHYSYNEVYYWISFKDANNPNAYLLENAGNVDAYVDDNAYISTYIPDHLEVLNEDVPFDTENNQTLYVDVAVQEPLKKMCAAIENEEYFSEACGGLLVENGYISYQQQTGLYDQAKEKYGELANMYEFYPGHSEHQLGLAIDFSIEGVSDSLFSKTEQYHWLQKNAYKYGFVQTYDDADSAITNKIGKSYHYRYVGIDLSVYLHDSGLSFPEYEELLKETE